MQLRDYWLLFSKRWWVVFLVALTAVVATIIFSQLQTRVYRSSVKLTVSPSRYDYGLTLVIENLLRQYSERLQTDRLASAVNERLELDLSNERLREKIRVSPVSEDYILMLTVDDTDPNRARDIAFVWADEFVKQQQILMSPVDPRDRIDVALLDRPTPGELHYPRTRQFVIAAAVLGLVVGALLAFVLEYIDDTIKSGEDVERYAGLAVLGSIPSIGAADAVGDLRPKVRVN